MESTRSKLFFDKFIYIFLLLSPIVDALTSIFVNRFDFIISIGTIVKGCLFLISFIWVYRNTNKKKLLLIVLIYFILSIMYFFTKYQLGFTVEIVNIFRIFYLPILMLFFSEYKNDKINDKLILFIYLIYLNLIIIPYIFNIGFNLSDSYVNKEGFFGLFSSGNEISGVLIGLGVITLNYVNNLKNIFLKIIVYIELLIAVLLIGTKALFLCMVIIVIYFIYKKIKYSFVISNNKKIVSIIIGIILIGLSIVLLPKSPMIKNLKTTLDYYNIKDVKSFLKVENIDNIIFSKRLSKAKDASEKFFVKDVKTIIYGVGSQDIEMIEIDIFDIFFSIGVFGSFIYVLIMLYVFRTNELKGDKLFAFYILLVISVFQGHVLVRPMVSIVIALLLILNKNDLRIEKKRILLVSNMYPSKKYKHYGSFVRNTKELLESNGFIVDKVTMSKTDNKIVKLFSYITFYSLVILKGIFNNYDYIYSHFISHTGLPVVFLKKTSANLKVVFNAHGNDVVADTNVDEKNVIRSRKYIKYADKVIVPSKYFSDIMAKDYNVPKEKIVIYPSGGVDTKRFKKIDSNQAKKECNLDSKYNYIGYISRLEKDKGYDVFLKAISNIKDKKGYKFLVVGTGAEEDNYNDLVKELKLENYIEKRSFVSQDELINIYNSLDIFVFPTYRKSESLGLVGLEAMACETVVVASDNYGPTSYVEDKKNGFFFKSKDDKDLAKKIEEVLKMKANDKNSIKSKARETALKFDVNKTKNIILEVFK